jgi:hypothetical protein
VPDIIGRLLAVKTNRLLLQVFWGQEHLEFKPEPERTTAPPHKTPRHWLRGRAGRPRRRRPMSQCASPTHGGAATGGGGRGRAEKRALSPFFFRPPGTTHCTREGVYWQSGLGFHLRFSFRRNLRAQSVQGGSRRAALVSARNGWRSEGRHPKR